MNKQTLTLVLVMTLTFSCQTRNEKSNLVAFERTIKCDRKGYPHDSTVLYFPSHLFHDTIPCFSDVNGIHRLDYFNKKEYSERFNVDIQTLKDTFEVIEDTFMLKLRSYTLFKMDEPILYDHYLKSEIYRLIPMRSFNKPLVIRIEKQHDSITINIKRLNRQIMYPFIVYEGLDSLVYTTPEIKYYDSIKKTWIISDTMRYHELFVKAKKSNDSIAKLYNVIDYHLIENYKKKIPITEWDSIQTLIDSSKFWTTKPGVALDYLQVDGSQWIFEGHSKEGYQIKIIPNPNFENSNDNMNTLDEKNYYTKIFQLILLTSGLKNESLY